jgi:hypothetical protein
MTLARFGFADEAGAVRFAVDAFGILDGPLFVWFCFTREAAAGVFPAKELGGAGCKSVPANRLG